MKKNIKCKIFKNICFTSHPKGCFKSVESQIQYIKDQGKFDGPKNVLILGSSTGYGLASRIVSAFANNAHTIGVAYEKPGTDDEIGTAGWYNTQAFEKLATESNLKHHSINGDAFSNEVKQQVVKYTKENNIKLDLIVYSLAAPKRTDPKTGNTHNSVIKTIGKPFTYKTIDIKTEKLYEASIEPATQQEIDDTIKVMGGEDWELWIELLKQENVLDNNVKTVAYSYIGPEFTKAIYRNGTLGKAKEHLEQTVPKINNLLKPLNGHAYVSINKALITKASAVIPAVPLYICILYKIMKNKNIHENCIHQIYRLFTQYIYKNEGDILLDDLGRIRIDDLELREDVQSEVSELFYKANSENLQNISDLAGFKEAFMQFHGFMQVGVNYQEQIELSDWK